MVVHHSEAELRWSVSLLCGFAEPPGDGFSVILWDAAAIGVPHPEFVLCGGMAPLGRLPEPGDRFNVIQRDAATLGVHHPEATASTSSCWTPRAVGVHPSEVALRAGETLLCGFAEPGDRFSVILRDAFAISIHEPEEILHRGITLLCVQTEDGVDVILRTRDAIHATEFVLRGGIALPCGLAVPSNGFSVILRNAAAVDVPHLVEVELRLDVALLRGFAVPGDGFDVILRNAFAGGIPQPEEILRRGPLQPRRWRTDRRVLVLPQRDES